MGKMRKRTHRFEPQRCLIDLGPCRIERSTFDPTVADTDVLSEPLCIIGGLEKPIGSPQVVPFLPSELKVAATRHVIVHSNNEQRGGVGGGKGKWLAVEPVQKTGALRNFVSDFTIGPLVLAEEVHGIAGCGEITSRIQSQRSPLRISAKKPSETGALVIGGGVESCDQAFPQEGVLYH